MNIIKDSKTKKSEGYDNPLNNDNESFKSESLLKEAQLLEQDQKKANEMDNESLDDLYNSSLISYIQSKKDQVDKIENTLEKMIDSQQAKMQSLLSNKPGVFAMPGKKNNWNETFSKQQNRLGILHNRLDVVKEIKEGMGAYSPKINELATKKMRFDNKELAKEWDSLQEANRMHQVLKNKKQLDNKQTHKNGVSIKLTQTVNR